MRKLTGIYLCVNNENVDIADLPLSEVEKWLKSRHEDSGFSKSCYLKLTVVSPHVLLVY